MTPALAEKLVELKLAIPLTLVEALSMVTAEPVPEVLLIVKVPLRPSRLVTPPLPGQADQVGAPAVETRQLPADPATNELSGLVPLPRRIPLAARLVAPLPPLETPRVPLTSLPRARLPVDRTPVPLVWTTPAVFRLPRVKPLKVGVAVLVIS